MVSVKEMAPGIKQHNFVNSLVSVPRSLPHKVSCGESSSGIALKVFWSCAAKNKGKCGGQWRTHLLFDSALKKEATTIYHNIVKLWDFGGSRWGGAPL